MLKSPLKPLAALLKPTTLKVTRSFLTFFAIFLTGTVVLFGFQNCGKARMGFTGDPTAAQSLGATELEPNCPAGQSAIGLNSSGQILCVTLTTSTDNLCNNSSYLYGYDSNGKALCVPVSSRNSSYTMCDANREIATYTTQGAITCVRMPGARPSYDCSPPGFLIGVVSGNAVCSGVPNPPIDIPPGTHTCPTGYAYGGMDDNGQMICTTIIPTFPTGLTCPAGQAIVGATSGHAICQSLMPAPHPEAVCPSGQFAQTQSSSAVTCATPPQTDLSYLCESGKYLSSLSSAGLTCLPLPSSDIKFNGTCPQGQYLLGFSGQNPICTNSGGSDPNYTCPRGSYLSGIVNGTPVCLPFDDNAPCGKGLALVDGVCKDITPPVINVTKAPVDSDSHEALIEFEVTDKSSVVSSVTCILDGVTKANCQSPLTLTNLANGFHELVITATDTQGNSIEKRVPWTVLSCAPGVSVSCPVANGSGAMVCKADGSAYGTCGVATCNSGYVKSGDSCVPMTCDAGYVFENGVCVDKTKPVITVTARPQDGTSTSGQIVFAVSDVGSGVKTVTCQLDGRTYTPCTSPVNLTNLLVGYHEFEIYALDNAGNRASTHIQWNIGNCTPGSKVTCDISNGQGQKSCNSDGLSFGSCAPVSCDSGYRLDNGACVPVTCPAGYELGSTNTCVDKTKPSIVINWGPMAITGDWNAGFGFTATDSGSGIARSECSIDGSNYVTCSSPVRYDNIGAGNHQFFVRTIDNAGNFAEASWNWVVRNCDPGSQRTCSINNGAGAMTCKADGTGFGSCQPTSCQSGYHIENGSCLPDGNGGKDAVCRKGAHASFFVEKWAPLASTLPSTCQNGVEIWNVKMNNQVVLKSSSAAGTAADRQIDLDYATYKAANTSRITAILADGSSQEIFHPCLISTHADVESKCLTSGAGSRPIDPAIRDFRIVIPKGTVELRIVGLDNDTPWYLKIKGLCDFNLSGMSTARTLTGNEIVRTFGTIQKTCEVKLADNSTQSSSQDDSTACGNYAKQIADQGKTVDQVKFDGNVIYQRDQGKECKVVFGDWSHHESHHRSKEECLKKYWHIRHKHHWKRVSGVYFDGSNIRPECGRD